MASTFDRIAQADVEPSLRSARGAWMDVDWRRHQRWVTVRSCPVNVIELGKGAPLLFVHGLGGSWQNWLEQIPVFAQQRRVIAIDLPGFGYSPMPAEPISIEGYARTVDELCGALDIDAAAVVGNSMGGLVAAELAVDYPQRVERLALVSAAGISTVHQPQARLLPLLRLGERYVTAYTAWMAARSEVVARRPRLRRAALRTVALNPAEIPAPLAAEQMRGAGKPGFVDAFQALTLYPMDARLPRIACPTLIVWGDSDRLIPPRDADEFERLIPGSRKLLYADTGHVAMLERPARFNADLAAFLAE